MKNSVIAAFACFVILAPIALAGAEVESAPAPKIPSYECPKVENKAITIDGKLDETCWGTAAPMIFRELVDGSEADFETFTRLVWDDEYLYVAFDIRDPNVWARSALLDGECSAEYADKVFFHDGVRSAEWRRLECNIMFVDKYVKIFLDPDADGKRYAEFHINPLNLVFDAWYDQGYKEKWGDQERGDHVVWACEGLVTAVHIDGTLNAPHDVDKGWSVEMAIPWKSLAPLTHGACPPKMNDVWTAHLGRTQREAYATKTDGWTWPVIGKDNCHLPHRYGRLVFKETPAKLTSPTGQRERTTPKVSDSNVNLN